ncbi:MAG: pseudouridine-5'-phosphate glycosidase [Bacteroidetes bacterium]|nr:MAG: pseudouridine-5'-phosphate glycosidase [Bacteroidota bacterium]REK06989.1 MAG: pseudouridine-5'-phosphate glycosidase [Bacteroidota bacterium]REK33664.1 MAG: pseudouridine-5'-phosphate glycosidase [Bacteroidota bacterium]REK48650.1 MAG: pseudouridine-5'-phosphate glycosidase [Bacteroidota bacterium]
MKNHIEIHKEVQEALKQGQAVVALESTIIAHGMPWPENMETAMAVEKIIRDKNAIPATIAILDGKICIGLKNSQLEHVAKSKDVLKVSTREIAYVCSSGKNGATTVASSMKLASLAGIKVFVTGGTGGVHRNGENTMDVSTDLTLMSKTPVAVVSAGVKSILDIGLTLETLETLGVPVITFRSDYFPSFYSSASPYLSPLRMNDTAEIAKLIRTHFELGMESSVLVANPVPHENEIPYDEIESLIQTAINKSQRNDIKGKDITPYLLKEIAEASGGRSLATNIALIKNNAVLGADIAKAMEF